MHGRKWLVRTFVGMKEKTLLVPFEKQLAAFVKEVEDGCTGFTEEQMKSNVRGPHFCSIMGHDRNNKKVSGSHFTTHGMFSKRPFQKPALSLWHKKNQVAIEKLMERDGAFFLLT